MITFTDTGAYTSIQNKNSVISLCIPDGKKSKALGNEN